MGFTSISLCQEGILQYTPEVCPWLSSVCSQLSNQRDHVKTHHWMLKILSWFPILPMTQKALNNLMACSLKPHLFLPATWFTLLQSCCSPRHSRCAAPQWVKASSRPVYLSILATWDTVLASGNTWLTCYLLQVIVQMSSTCKGFLALFFSTEIHLSLHICLSCFSCLPPLPSQWEKAPCMHAVLSLSFLCPKASQVPNT